MTTWEKLQRQLMALRLEVPGVIVDDIEKTVNDLINDIPPLRLTPHYLHLQKRFNKVCGAITRYYEAGEIIPLNWVDEYNELLTQIKQNKNESTGKTPIDSKTQTGPESGPQVT